ncbi:MAG TPA: hypothetical protein P5250_00660 [Bacteroidales bacterium]|nr:hypothetical protein [Bacteroidales bacterium]
MIINNVIKIHKILLTFLIIGITVSCKTDIKEIIEEKYPDDSPKLIRFYKEKNGEKEIVKEISFYPNHNKKIEGEYKNNKRHGKWTAWFEDGKIQSEGYFKNGLNHGSRKVYYENGNKRYEGKYENGKYIGKWKFYSPDGNLINEINFDK